MKGGEDSENVILARGSIGKKKKTCVKKNADLRKSGLDKTKNACQRHRTKSRWEGRENRRFNISVEGNGGSWSPSGVAIKKRKQRVPILRSEKGGGEKGNPREMRTC